MRVYISTPAFHIRSRTNTDWQYLQMLKALPQHTPELTVYFQRSFAHDCVSNLRIAAAIGARRLHVSFLKPFVPGMEIAIPSADLRRSRCNVVYSYGVYPVNVSSVPVVYHTGATNDELLRSRGISEEGIERGKVLKREHAGKAALVTANSQAALDNLAGFMPYLRSKMRMVPFFLPHLEAVSEQQVEEKFRDLSSLKLLFVGRQGRLKGLPQVLEAFQQLNTRFPESLRLTVVSSMSDGMINLPRMPNLVHHHSKSRAEVQQLMRESHVMLMPSSGDGYGWVYLEAMAAGAVPVACDYPIQAEILDGGRAGLLVRQSVSSIVDALHPYIAQPEALREKAIYSRKHCAASFLPAVAAERMREVFAEAAEIGPLRRE